MDTKISNLTAITTLLAGSIFPVVYNPGTSTVTNKITLTNLKAAMVSGIDTYVLFNDGGTIGANSDFTYSKNTSTLAVSNVLIRNSGTFINGGVNIVELSGADFRVASLSGAGDQYVTVDSTGLLQLTNLTAFVGDSGSGGATGLVPAPVTGDATKFLRGDGTWVTISGGGNALTSNPLSQFAATTSLQLKGVMSDETGSGALVFATSPTLITPILGTPTSGNLANCTFPTLNQSTTGSAATLTTPRAIYGNNFDGSAALAQIIASTFGGTGNGFTKFSGPTTSEKTFTLPDASSTIVVQGGALGTPSSATLTNATGLPISGLTASTSTALGVGSIELGHASDTTIARVSAGVLSVEGVTIPTISSTSTLTNKRITKRTLTVTQSATPSINTDNADIVSITALAQAITSMTSGLSGTPVAGDFLMIQITDNGTARAISWGASFQSTSIILPTTTVISTMLRTLLQWNAVASKWDCIATDSVSSGGSGTVTTVSVVSANGFAGTVANATSTPAITLTTTITGSLYGNGTAISASKVTLTQPATGSTLTIVDGKTLTVNNTITLAGTDSTTMTFPSTSATLARTDAANTFTGHQTVEGVTSTGATGTGKFVFDGSPTLVTPVLGVATATSINKMAITAPATSSTLAVADGKTFTVSNTITLTGTDSTSFNVTNNKLRPLGFTVGDGINNITTGKIVGYFRAPYAGTITAWSFSVDAGTATVKCWKIASGTASPTSSNSINTSGVSISSNTSVRSTTLSDFTTTTVTANDIFGFEITTISGVKDMTFELELTLT